MNKNVLFAFVAMVSLVACSSNGTPGSWKEHNLLRYDLPISIMGPDSVIVISDNLLFAKDVTIEGALEKGFGVQIFSSEASSQDPKKIKAEELGASKQHKYFDELIQDDETGFIYSTKIDSAHIYHGFKYVKVQGAREYIYQNLGGRQFSLEEVHKMYSACINKKN